MNSFFDSNVLLYLLELQSPKRAVALRLASEGGVVSVQVLNEFTDVARRKHKLGFDDIAEALEPVRELCRIVALTPETHDLAFEISRSTMIRIYDACIVAAAELAGCDVLYTEDLNHGQRIGAVTIRNPFI